MGQIQGGAAQGAGMALTEEYIFSDDGRMENPTMLDYRMPTALDLPMVDALLVEVPNPGHPYGVRGVGEVPIIPPLAAVTNAIRDAIGVRATLLPASPTRILEWLEVKPRKRPPGRSIAQRITGRLVPAGGLVCDDGTRRGVLVALAAPPSPIGGWGVRPEHRLGAGPPCPLRDVPRHDLPCVHVAQRQHSAGERELVAKVRKITEIHHAPSHQMERPILKRARRLPPVRRA